MQHAGLLFSLHAMLVQQGGDSLLVGIGDIGQYDILVGRQAVFHAVELLGHAAQGRLLAAGLGVLHAARLDEEGQEPAAIHGLLPVVGVGSGNKLHRLGRLKFKTRPTGHLTAEPLHTLLLQDVLETGVLAVGAVTEVAEDGEHGLRHLDQRRAREEADHIGQAGIGDGVAMAATHAAAGDQIIAD